MCVAVQSPKGIMSGNPAVLGRFRAERKRGNDEFLERMCAQKNDTKKERKSERDILKDRSMKECKMQHGYLAQKHEDDVA